MRNTLRTLCTLLLGAILCSSLSGPAFAQTISVELNGRRLNFDQPPLMLDGRIMVPLRGIFEALQADVVYDAATRSIKATKEETIVQLQLGSRTALINGNTTYLDVPANSIAGRTMVPLRFVSESLGADVEWRAASKTVAIESGSSSTGGGSSPPPQEAGAPRIDRVIHNATNTVAPGQTIEVIVYGEPGAEASFEILGSTRAVNLPEVTSGRYQTRYQIPRGLQVTNGVVLATLRKNGRETAAEASRTITVGESGQSGSSGWSIAPEANGTVTQVRPQVSVTFPSAVVPNSVRLFVDGVNFSSQARLQNQNRRLTWTPSYDLAYGRHEVELEAQALRGGESYSQKWSFTVEGDSSDSQVVRNFRFDPTSARTGEVVIVRLDAPANSRGTFKVGNSPSQSLRQVSTGRYEGRYTVRSSDSNSSEVTANLILPSGQQVQVTAPGVLRFDEARDLSVTNLRNGMTVSPTFAVQGRATPGANVTVVLEYTSNNLLEAIAGVARRITRSGSASGTGHFEIQMDATAVPSGTSVRMTVSDSSGSPPVTLNLNRQ